MFRGSRARPVCEADNLTAIYEPTVYTMWLPQHLTTLQASTAFYRDSFNFSGRWWSYFTGNIPWASTACYWDNFTCFICTWSWYFTGNTSMGLYIFICRWCSYLSGDIPWASTAYYGDRFTFFLYNLKLFKLYFQKLELRLVLEIM
jgi:hypothetical protein